MKTKIMLVDDNDEYLMLLKDYIDSQSNMEVVLASTEPLKVLDNIEKYKPDILVIDVMMPEKEGIEVIKDLKKSNIKNKPGVIVMSGQGQDVITQKAMAYGAMHYIIKPFELSTLVERIKDFTVNQDVRTLSEGGKVSYVISNKKLLNEEKTMEMKVTELIHEVGVPAHIRGYQFVREAILLAIKSRDYIDSVTKVLYPSLAEAFNTTPSRVERAIRHAIEVAWNRGSVDVHNKVFGYTINSNKGKPTNAEFIAKIADKLVVENCLVN